MRLKEFFLCEFISKHRNKLQSGSANTIMDVDSKYLALNIVKKEENMIGFLITGHAEFPNGLFSSVHMIAGEQEGFDALNFQENVNLEEYETNLKNKVEDLLDKNESVLIFTDLLGGTPFRTAMVIASEFENVEVVTGTNLPMLLEATSLRFIEDVNLLVDQLIQVGQEGLQHPQLELDEEDTDEESFEGGI